MKKVELGLEGFKVSRVCDLGRKSAGGGGRRRKKIFIAKKSIYRKNLFTGK